ncbi:MAG TPA: methyl-accepting chemotaxis protein [Gallionellaceae bacterium]|nr:methyl-accepting chemotaxis protein [Gallionellaceae bacterium]
MAFKLNIPKLNNPFKKAGGASRQSGKPMGIPGLGRMPIGKQLQLLGVALLVFLMIAVVSAYFDNRAASNGTQYVEEASRLLMLSQRLAKDAQQSLAGNFNAFEGLTQSRQNVTQVMATLDMGDAHLPPTRGKPREALNELIPTVNSTLANVRLMEEGRTGLLTLARAITVISSMELELRGMSQQMIEHSGSSVAATRFALLVERMAKDATSMLAEVSTDQIASLGMDTIEADEILSRFPQNDPLVQDMREMFDGYRVAAETIIGNSQNLLGAKRAGKAIFDGSDQFLEQAQKLTDAYQASLSNRFTSYTMAVAGIMVILLLALLAKVYLEDTRHRAQEAEHVNSVNQQAILRLMNELSDLANGDLTVKATVSEDITGAIADSVNYTTDELRKLVVGVTSASQLVAKATSEAGAVTKELLVATQKQSEEIREAGSAVELMTKSIQEVDASASKSAEAARKTLHVTAQGAQAVQNSISGMDGIREQIQETSKRIKRLGESSQEIGEIVDLISDITEQTNVLALNAAIQAASAGEAGRGFSVVAEEVQRLAERSGEATKQIGLLVKAIQSDTQDAVTAMEKSTQGVVEGARLSDAAGQALREIEETTHELADSVNSISVSTQMQTDMASEVATLMTEILQITKQTTDNTQRTNTSVAQLEKLASDLSSSVAGFKV